jgi:hypothetical protein
MNKDLMIIKKQFGEKMMHFCRDQFSTLLEHEGLLSELLINSFNGNHSLYEDLEIYGKTGAFKSYIYSLADLEKKTASIETETSKETEAPFKLLSDAGYVLYECRTEEEIQAFKKYYSVNEELCTFNGGRLDRCYVFLQLKRMWIQ